MPKVVDHAERRRVITEAARRVIVRDGVAAATVREIAREAGVATGILGHYFASKEEILIETHRMAFQSVGERADAKNVDTRGLAALRVALYEALPLDDLRRDEAILDLAFWSQAIGNEELNKVRRESQRLARFWWLRMIADARSAGEITMLRDDDAVVDWIVWLCDAAAVSAVLYPEEWSPARVQGMADSFFEILQS